MKKKKQSEQNKPYEMCPECSEKFIYADIHNKYFGDYDEKESMYKFYKLRTVSSHFYCPGCGKTILIPESHLKNSKFWIDENV